MSKIEWTDRTWNPWHGCRKIAPECDRCYAAVFDSRNLHPHFLGVAERSEWTGKLIRATESARRAPFWFPRRSRMRPGGPTLVFTCSMSDFWHEDIPLDWLAEALDVIAATPHIYLVLTKRPGNVTRKLAALNRELPANAWLGLTVGHPQSLPLLKPFKRIPATLRFLVVEPLLAPMVPGLDLAGIGWVIAGGESERGARICQPDWMRAVRDLCVSNVVPFFLKQWGGPQGKGKPAPWNPTPWAEELNPNAKGGATLDGRLWREFPI